MVLEIAVWVGTAGAAVWGMIKAYQRWAGHKTHKDSNKGSLVTILEFIQFVREKARGPHINIFLVATGGTGKTQLIRSLTNNENAQPQKKTTSAALYSHSMNYTLAGERLPLPVTINVVDHVGQSMATVGEIAQGLPDIHIVVFMVDVRNPPPKYNQQVQPSSNVDDARIKVHRNLWNEDMLSLTYGTLKRDSLSYVVLFVNKLDLITDRSETMMNHIREQYSSIRTELVNLTHAEERVVSIYGSALKGEGVPQLNQLIFAVMKEQAMA
jgi:GTPase SAR1 family protein